MVFKKGTHYPRLGTTYNDKVPNVPEFDKRWYDPAFFIRNMLDLEVTKFHYEWLQLAEKNRFSCIMAPRGFGKTEVLIIGFTLFKLYEAIMDKHYKKRSTPFEAMIVSKSLPQSSNVLRRIKYKIVDSPILSKYLPSGRDTVISTTKLILVDRDMIICRPYGDSVRGEHLDVACIDEAGTFDDKSYFKYAILPTVNKKKGKIVTIGTPTSQTDLLFELFMNTSFKSKKYQAFLNPTKMALPLWPSEFSKKDLEMIKETLGSLAFSREYLCEPIGDEDRMFPYPLISQGFIDNAKWIKERNPFCDYYMGCDFAMSAATGADYSVFIVVEKDKKGRCRLANMYRVKGSPFEFQMAKIISFHKQYQPVNTLVDSRSFGRNFYHQMRTYGMNVEEYMLTNDSKNTLISHLAQQFEKVKVLIPRSNETFEMTKQMIKELTSYTALLNQRTRNIMFESLGQHDDCVIGLALAIYAATRFVYNQISIKRTRHSM